MALRCLGLATLLALFLPLSAGADAPRFQTFATTDPDAPAHAFRVSDEGCTVLIRESADYGGPPYHRLREGRVQPLRDLARGEAFTWVGGLSGSGDRSAGNIEVDLDQMPPQAFVMEDGIPEVNFNDHWPFKYRDLSRDGSTAVGYGGGFNYGALRVGPAGGVLQPGGGRTRAIATAVSDDGDVAAGYSYDPKLATLWNANAGDIPETLGMLPGESESEALGISGDGSTVVGRSGARAFRWHGGTMQDLGPGQAVAANQDGSVVLGDTFLWDAVNGRRPLAEALEADFGVDLSAWSRLEGGDVSPDGLSVVGSAALPGGTPRAFRARNRPDACPGATLPRSFPLVTEEILGAPYFTLGAHVATDGTAWVGDYQAGRIWRTRERSGPDDPWDPPELLFDPTPALGKGWPFATGPEGETYLSTSLEHFYRLDPDGTLTPLFDASGLPDPVIYNPIDDVDIPIATRGVQAVFGPDGTLFVAANARALRLDPDGSVTELFDQPQVVAWTDYDAAGILGVVLLPDDRLLWLGSFDGVVTDAAGNLIELMDGVVGAWVAPDAGLYTLEDGRLHHTPPGGAKQLLYPIDDDGNEYFDYPAAGPFLFVSDGGAEPYVIASDDAFNSFIVRIGTDGHVTPIVPTTGWSLSSGLHSVLTTGREILQVQAHAPPTACTNGFDDDGDGRSDFEDPGCEGADDPSERSDALPCDDGEDGDGDGLADFPDDPGCASWTAPTEAPECSDGEDNDNDGRVDWDGAGVGAPDPQCAGRPSGGAERDACGLGFELGLLALAARAWRRRRGAPDPSPA